MTFKQVKSIDSGIDVILPFRKDKIDCDQIYALTRIKDPVFEATFAEIQILYDRVNDQSRRIYLLGLGGEEDAPRLGDCFRKMAFETSKYWADQIQINCLLLEETEITRVVTGLEMATYNIGAFKSDKEDLINTKILLINENNISESINEGKLIGETINRIKFLVDAPSNQKTPEYLADWSLQSARAYDYQCKIRNEAALRKEGFGSILAVGGGSVHPPFLIECSYLPKGGKTVDIGLVGKGITFDSGGLSIKAAQNMHYMKSDMGGAAVVLGIVELVARLQLNVNIIGVVAAAENAVSADSFRPGDVIRSYSGKTIEIIDTDAEGRLVLADAISYMIKNYHPEKVIDIATLTGSVVRTLGYSAGGMFTKSKELSDDLVKSGNLSDEKVWPLPLFDEFDKDLDSDIADIKNFSSKPIAGGIIAAKFIEAFTEKHQSWVHLDIAGMAFGDSTYAKMKSATGYGIKLIFEYIKLKINDSKTG